MKHLRRWAAAYILFVMFLVSFVLQAYFMMDEIAQEGWDVFGAAVFENLQSEWAQLFVQAVLVVGFADYVFRKATEDQRRVEHKVDFLLRKLEIDPEEVERDFDSVKDESAGGSD